MPLPVRRGLSRSTLEKIRMSDRRILVTGAGGWIGMATLDFLHQALGPAFSDRVHAFGSSHRRLVLRDGTVVPQRPLDELQGIDRRPSLLLHLAFLTKDRADAMSEAEYRTANRKMGDLVLDAAARVGADAIFVASSGAARFADDFGAPAAMRIYGELKRDDERRFAAWAQHSGGSAVIARIFNLSGPYINKRQAYALASFIVDALAKRPVTVTATRQVWRSYVPLSELVSLALDLLLEPERQVVEFDTAGEEILEMRSIAAMVAGIVGEGRVEAAPLDPAAKPDRYVGDGAGYVPLLKARSVARATFEEQIHETADDIASTSG